jgi:hypothetical protein
MKVDYVLTRTSKIKQVRIFSGAARGYLQTMVDKDIYYIQK